MELAREGEGLGVAGMFDGIYWGWLGEVQVWRLLGLWWG